jgi:hypothetical protein
MAISRHFFPRSTLMAAVGDVDCKGPLSDPSAHAAAFDRIQLANDGHDTRSLVHYLGHRNLQSTAKYTALAPDRFARFYQD